MGFDSAQTRVELTIGTGAMASNKSGKIAFIRVSADLVSNKSALEMLRGAFPDHHIETIDVFPDLVRRREIWNVVQCLRFYGIEILTGDKQLSISLMRTPYLFKKVQVALSDLLDDQEFRFTFQTQSIFNARVPGIPHFVYTDHTHLANLQVPGFRPRQLYAPAWIECESTIYQNATLNFTRSTNISRSMIEDYSCDPQKVRCVYCGSNVEVSRDEAFDDDRYRRKRVLFIGVDWERKGGPTLVKAFRILLKTHPDAVLTIVGCSPNLDLPHCEIVGKVTLREVKQFLRKASIFCLPTTLEPFGIAFLEAMAHKLPIVATNIGAIPDFVHEGENGYLVEPRDPEELAKRLSDLVGSPARCRAFGEVGHHIYWNQYTWERTGKRIREHIESAI